MSGADPVLDATLFAHLDLRPVVFTRCSLGGRAAAKKPVRFPKLVSPDAVAPSIRAGASTTGGRSGLSGLRRPRAPRVLEGKRLFVPGRAAAGDRPLRAGSGRQA